MVGLGLPAASHSNTTSSPAWTLRRDLAADSSSLKNSFSLSGSVTAMDWWCSIAATTSNCLHADVIFIITACVSPSVMTSGSLLQQQQQQLACPCDNFHITRGRPCFDYLQLQPGDVTQRPPGHVKCDEEASVRSDSGTCCVSCISQ